MIHYNKFAILSHILPPAWSGQANVLYRLLDGVPPEEYCLITAGQTSGNATHALPGQRWQLDKPLKGWERMAKWTGPFAVWLAIWQAERRAKQIEGILRSENCSMLIACSGDLLDIPAGAIAAKRAGVAFVPYFFDDYLFQWTGWRRTVAHALERMAMGDAAGAIVPNEFLHKEYETRYPVSSIIVHNPVHLSEMSFPDDMETDDRKDLTIVYTGAIYHAHYDAFRNLVAALDRLGNPRLKLHLYTAQSEEELAANGICGPQVVTHPHVPQNEVLNIQRCADVLFLPLAFESPIPEVIRTSAPGKMGEYLAVGRPILAHVPPETFVGWYLNTHGCGVVVDRNDPDELVVAMTRIVSDPNWSRDIGIMARKRAEIDFDLIVAKDLFYSFVREVTCSGT